MAELPALLVCICTNGTPERVRATLAAACAQSTAAPGSEVVLVASGLGAAEREAHRRQAGELGARVLDAPAGTAAARNRALEEARDDDVLAFIDDDVVPAPDWLAKLRERWERAGADIACIGGAVEPRWEEPPPAWVSERIATAFALLDLGPGTVELDPGRAQGVWTANASFRAAALREAGGFPPHLGPWRDAAIIGEDSAAQRRLAERGGRILYAGDVRVAHLIPRLAAAPARPLAARADARLQRGPGGDGDPGPWRRACGEGRGRAGRGAGARRPAARRRAAGAGGAGHGRGRRAADQGEAAAAGLAGLRWR